MPPQLRISPGTRSRPSRAAQAARPRHASAAARSRVPRASSRTTNAGRPAIGSLTSRPLYTATPAGSPGAPAAGSSTKNPALTAASHRSARRARWWSRVVRGRARSRRRAARGTCAGRWSAPATRHGPRSASSAAVPAGVHADAVNPAARTCARIASAVGLVGVEPDPDPAAEVPPAKSASGGVVTSSTRGSKPAPRGASAASASACARSAMRGRRRVRVGSSRPRRDGHLDRPPVGRVALDRARSWSA